jgi:hypothetical protein
MKYTLAGIFLLYVLPIFAQQTVTEKFQKIATVEQAKQFITENPELKPALLYL